MYSVCKCGRGYSSSFDNLCKFCRENKLSRSDCKKVGVKHKGDGLTIEQLIEHQRLNGDLNVHI